MDRPIQFLRYTLVDDGFTQAETWMPHGEVHMAKKQDVSDGERWRAGEVAAHITARFVVRFSPFIEDITPLDRLECENTTYEIVGKKEQSGRRRLVEFTCTTRSDQP